MDQDRRFFTLAAYRALLREARDRGYSIATFREFHPDPDRRQLLLRHDLDHSLRAAGVIGECEAEEGVRSTFFVQTACAMYNILSREGRAIIRRLADLQHEIGLHYESSRYVGPSGHRALLSDKRLLEDLCGDEVVSAAQHIPIDSDRISLAPYIPNEAYQARFTEPPMSYISDSLMAWRQATPYEYLEAGRSFQLLTHPEQWDGTARDVAGMLEHVTNQEIEAARRRCTELQTYYARLLRQRSELDRSFEERKRKESS